jgi:transcriptional regulator with XRE-family HTH domain
MGISDRINELRSRLGITRSELARRAGCSVPTVWSVETGSGSITSMLRIMGALNGSLAWSDRNWDEPLGKSLASARHQAGMSQRTMAAMIGVTQPTVVALERRSQGRMQTLERCLDALALRASVIPETPSSEPKGRRLVPARNNPFSDIVYTPRSLAQAVISHFPLSGAVLDPCRGGGAFFDQFPSHVNGLWCEIGQGRDFLNWQAPVQWIVTNPPWSKFRSFLVHGMKVSENIVFLAAFNHFGTKARQADIRNHGFGIRSVLFVPTPKSFPQSGLQLCAMWLQRGWKGPCEMKELERTLADNEQSKSYGPTSVEELPGYQIAE